MKSENLPPLHSPLSPASRTLRNVSEGFLVLLYREPNNGETIMRFDCQRPEIGSNSNLDFFMKTCDFSKNNIGPFSTIS